MALLELDYVIPRYGSSTVAYGVSFFQQWDTPYRIYHRPVNRRVANFGQGVFVPGVALGDGRVEIGIVGARVSSHYDHAVDEEIGIRIGVEHVVAFDDSERPAFPSSARMRGSWQ